MGHLALDNWDFAFAVSGGPLNHGLQTLPAATVTSSEGKVALSATLGAIGIIEIRSDALRMMVPIASGTLTVTGQSERHWTLDGIAVAFDVPLTEMTPDGPSANAHIALDFRHAGTGQGSKGGKIEVFDPLHRINPPSALLSDEIAKLVINAFRADPATEKLILASVLTGTGGGIWGKPRHYRCYLGRNSRGEGYLAVLVSCADAPPASKDDRLPDDFLPPGEAAIFAINRQTFFAKLVVPAVTQRLSSPITPVVTNYPVADLNVIQAGVKFPWALWNGTFQTLSTGGGNVELKDLALLWADTFGVNLSMGFLLGSVTVNCGFRLELDQASQNLKTTQTHDANVTDTSNFAMSAVVKMLGDDWAKHVAGVFPSIHVRNFAQLDDAIVHWPALQKLKVYQADLEDCFAPQFHLTPTGG